jgi:uncharacterized protein (DUF2062 family)
VAVGVIRRIVTPFVNLLRQGITPEKVALTIAIGLALGVTPVIGSTTLLCTIAAIVLRLNLPAIQLVNGLVYPLQLALIIPFVRGGAWMFGDRVLPGLTVGRMFELIRADLWHAIALLWTATMHALAAWLLCSGIAAAVVYAAALPALRKVWRRELRAQ